MQAIVDGDVLTHRYAAAGEYTNFFVTDEEDQTLTIRGSKKTKEWLGGHPARKCTDHEGVLDPVENILHSVKLALQDVKEVCKCREPIVYIGKGKNFRHDLYNIYKFDRIGRTRPVHYGAVKDYLIEYYDAQVVEGIEADDALATYASENKDVVVCSVDKDLLQVAGYHYNFITHERQVVKPKDAHFNLFTQCLSGDSVDNIPGIPGVGSVKAGKIVADCQSAKDLFTTVRAAYGDDDKFRLNAELVFLRRKEGQDFWEWATEKGLV